LRKLVRIVAGSCDRSSRHAHRSRGRSPHHHRYGCHLFQVKHVEGGVDSEPPTRDLVAVGLEHAWRYALEGKSDPDLEQAIATAFRTVPPGEEPEADLKGSGDNVGVAYTIDAIKDPTPQSADEALMCGYYAVFGMSNAVEALEGREREVAATELEWQNRMLAALAARGDAPLNRGLFAAFIAEQLPWREHLDAYRAGCE
jgi:hypothetical protein